MNLFNNSGRPQLCWHELYHLRHQNKLLSFFIDIHEIVFHMSDFYMKAKTTHYVHIEDINHIEDIFHNISD